MTEHIELAAWVGGYALLCSLTPWAIPLGGVVEVFGYMVYSDGYFG